MLSSGSIEKSKISNYNSINQIPCGLKTRSYIYNLSTCIYTLKFTNA